MNKLPAVNALSACQNMRQTTQLLCLNAMTIIIFILNVLNHGLKVAVIRVINVQFVGSRLEIDINLL